MFSSGSFVLLVEFHPMIQHSLSIHLWKDLGLFAVFRCCECLCTSDSWVDVFVSLDYVETSQRDFWLARFNGCLTLQGRDKLFCKEVVLFCIPPVLSPLPTLGIIGLSDCSRYPGAGVR